MLRHASSACLVVLAVASLAHAADLKPAQEEAKTAFDKQMRDLVAEVNSSCGTRFSDVKSDFENYSKDNFKQMPPGQTCSRITYALKEVCKSEPYKKALVKKVKGLACLTTPKDPPFAMVGDTFTFHMSPKADGLAAVSALKAELDK